MNQARRGVERHLATARAVYDYQLQSLKRSIDLTAAGTVITDGLTPGEKTSALAEHLLFIRDNNEFDFLTLVDRTGRAVSRAPCTGCRSGDLSEVPILGIALDGKAIAATEILSAEQLAREDPRLIDVARLDILPTPHSTPPANNIESSGMVLLAAAPVRTADGTVVGAMYGGILLTRNVTITDRVNDLLYRGETYRGRPAGSATIFQGRVRVATTLTLENGDRAYGTLASDAVRDVVISKGTNWNDRSFTVNDWYVSAYEPIRNHNNDVIGMLYVGVLEKVYTSTRDRVILSFFLLAAFGFLLISAVTDYMVRNITRPLREMVAATRGIAAGRFDHVIGSAKGGEIALLAESFSAMQKSLQQMKKDLEEWGKTLEDRVKERTDELVAMQARVAQSERLASMGMLAAGVAHEINNPLGGILSLTALALEDLPPDATQRSNLEEVVKQSERCREIVKGLLEFSRQSETGTERVDINEILEDTLALIGQQAAFFNVTIKRHLDPGLPRVTGDRSQLQQVFMNLFLNAVQAMEEKGTMTLVTRRTPEGEASVAVSDTGRGIPRDQVHRIFDPFYTTKRGGEGTGLGLSIVYGIVKKHLGSISVDSDLGKGATFTIVFPPAAEHRMEVKS